MKLAALGAAAAALPALAKTKRHLEVDHTGKVNIPGILDLMAGRKIHGMVMGELDNDPKNPSPTAPVELVKTSKLYLETQGITFRA